MGQTVLHVATPNGNSEVMQVLLDRGSSIEAICTGPGNIGQTALHIAASSGRHGVVKLLLDRGAGIDAITHQTRYPCLATSGPSQASWQPLQTPSRSRNR